MYLVSFTTEEPEKPLGSLLESTASTKSFSINYNHILSFFIYEKHHNPYKAYKTAIVI